MKRGSLLPQSASPLEIPPAPLRPRRQFVMELAALASSAALLGYDLRSASAEPPPETTKLTLFENPVTCLAPQYVAKDLLHAEGFSDVRYLKWPTETKNWSPEIFLSGEADIGLVFVPSGISQIDAGSPVVILGGSHIGCVELVGGPLVKTARDLKESGWRCRCPGPTSRFSYRCSPPM